MFHHWAKSKIILHKLEITPDDCPVKIPDEYTYANTPDAESDTSDNEEDEDEPIYSTNESDRFDETSNSSELPDIRIDKPYKCHCGSSFCSVISLNCHQKYDCGRTFQCNVCYTKCNFMNNLRRHMLQSHDIEVSRTDLCKVQDTPTFSVFQQIIPNRLEVTPDDCPAKIPSDSESSGANTPGDDSETSDDETDEEESTHSTDDGSEQTSKSTVIAADVRTDKAIKCQCGTSFSHVDSLSFHLKYECGKLFRCNVCEKKSWYESSFRTHMLKQHGIELSRDDICTVQNTTTYSVFRYDANTDTPHPIQVTYSTGKLSGNEETTNSSVSAGKRTDKSVKCPCGTNFSHVDSLSFHMKYECGKLFRCNVCQMKSWFESTFRRHMLNKHAIQLSRDDICKVQTTPTFSVFHYNENKPNHQEALNQADKGCDKIDGLRKESNKSHDVDILKQPSCKPKEIKTEPIEYDSPVDISDYTGTQLGMSFDDSPVNTPSESTSADIPDTDSETSQNESEEEETACAISHPDGSQSTTNSSVISAGIITSDNRYQCQCGSSFSYGISLNCHLKYDCGKSFQCNICGMKCNFVNNIIKHMLQQHDIKIRKSDLCKVQDTPYVCVLREIIPEALEISPNNCSVNRPSVDTLDTNHKTSDNETYQEETTCLITDKALGREETPVLTTSIRTDKSIKCQCGTNFSHVDSLYDHQKFECGKMFLCNICKKKSWYETSFRSHMQKKHNIEISRNDVCTVQNTPTFCTFYYKEQQLDPQGPKNQADIQNTVSKIIDEPLNQVDIQNTVSKIIDGLSEESDTSDVVDILKQQSSEYEEIKIEPIEYDEGPVNVTDSDYNGNQVDHQAALNDIERERRIIIDTEAQNKLLYCTVCSRSFNQSPYLRKHMKNKHGLIVDRDGIQVKKYRKKSKKELSLLHQSFNSSPNPDESEVTRLCQELSMSQGTILQWFKATARRKSNIVHDISQSFERDSGFKDGSVTQYFSKTTASDEENVSSTTTDVLTEFQQEILLSTFDSDPFHDEGECGNLAETLCMAESRVKVWFVEQRKNMEGRNARRCKIKPNSKFIKAEKILPKINSLPPRPRTVLYTLNESVDSNKSATTEENNSSVQDNKRGFKCGCGQGFAELKLLRNHKLHECGKKRNATETLCDSQAKKLKIESKMIENSSSTVTKCDLCSKQFKLRDSFRKHMKLKHDIVFAKTKPANTPQKQPTIPTNQADTPQKPTITTDQAETPQKQPTIPMCQADTPKKQQERFYCPCGISYTQQARINYHKKKECGKVFKCSQCPSEFSLIESIRKHLKEQHNLIIHVKEIVENYQHTGTKSVPNVKQRAVAKKSTSSSRVKKSEVRTLVGNCHTDVSSGSETVPKQNHDLACIPEPPKFHQLEPTMFKCGLCDQAFTSKVTLVGHLQQHI